MPTVGVVVPYSPEHTSARMLEEAKASVRQQSVETELYVIPDKEQRGPSWARNRGLERASERYVAFLDADDLWSEEKLERQLESVETADCGLCAEGDPDLSTKDFIGRLFRGEITSITSSILIDTRQVSVRFEEGLPRKEDHLFVLEAASQAGVCLRSDLVTIRKHDDGLSAEDDKHLMYEAKRRYVRLARQRVPEVEPFVDTVAARVWFGSGRLFHYQGDYRRALSAFRKSWHHQPSLRLVPAIGMVLFHWLSPVHPRDDGDGDLLTWLWTRYSHSESGLG